MADYGAGSNPQVTEEQRVYAQWLAFGWKTGFVLMVVLFFLYVSGTVSPYIPMSALSRYWSMSAPDYLAAAQLHQGWSWVYLANRGDFLNFVGIAFLALVTSVCFLRMLPVFIHQGDRVYTVIVVIETAVLALAASGILVAGH